MKTKKWDDTVQFVVDKYNDTEHTTTGVTPNYAATDKYHDVVKRTRRKRQRLVGNTTRSMKATWLESTKNLEIFRSCF